MNRSTTRSHRRKPPSAASRASWGVSSDSGESKFAAMNPSNSMRYRRVSQSRSRRYPAAASAPAKRLDVGGHPRRVAMHVESAAVGERSAVCGVDGHQFQSGRAVFADGREGVVDDVRHRQHGRPGVQPVAADVDAADPAAGYRVALDDRDLASSTGEVQCGRQSRQPGADHHHVIGASVHSADHHAVRTVQTAAMSASAVRTDSSMRLLESC